MTLSLAHCPGFSKFGFEKNRKGGSVLVRLDKDCNPVSLWHLEPVKGSQYFSFVINEDYYKDITFGVLGESAKVERVGEFPKDRVCYIGCISKLCNELELRKVGPQPIKGDTVTVAVDGSAKMVSFYVNGELMAGEDLPLALQERCFFFVGMATRHNKIRLL